MTKKEAPITIPPGKTFSFQGASARSKDGMTVIFPSNEHDPMVVVGAAVLPEGTEIAGSIVVADAGYHTDGDLITILAGSIDHLTPKQKATAAHAASEPHHKEPAKKH